MSKKILFVPRDSREVTVSDIAEWQKEYKIHYYDGEDILLVDSKNIIRFDEVFFKYNPDQRGFSPASGTEREESEHTNPTKGFSDVFKTAAEQAGARQGLDTLVKEISKMIDRRNASGDWPWLKR